MTKKGREIIDTIEKSEKEKEKRVKKSLTSRLILPVISFFVAFGLFMVVLNILNKDRTPSHGGAGLGISLKSSKNAEDITRYYNKEINPLIDNSEKRSRLTADKTINALHEKFINYRKGITPFVEDITAWGTRFGIVGRSAGDLWDKYWNNIENPKRVSEYVYNKYSAHIFSDEKLEKDIAEIIDQFQSDIYAERNRLFSEMKAPLTSANSPVLFDDKNFKVFIDDVNENVTKTANEMARDSVLLGSAAIVAGSVAGNFVQKIVKHKLEEAIKKWVKSRASTSIASGKAGSTAGPAGTVGGIVVGLIVGILLDWWATDKLEEELKSQCSQILLDLEANIVKGSNNSPGLRAVFDEAVRVNIQSQRNSILSVLKGGRV